MRARHPTALQRRSDFRCDEARPPGRASRVGRGCHCGKRTCKRGTCRSGFSPNQAARAPRTRPENRTARRVTGLRLWSAPPASPAVRRHRPRGDTAARARLPVARRSGRCRLRFCSLCRPPLRPAAPLRLSWDAAVRCSRVRAVSACAGPVRVTHAGGPGRNPTHRRAVL